MDEWCAILSSVLLLITKQQELHFTADTCERKGKYLSKIW